MGRSVTDETVWDIDGGPSLSILEEEGVFGWTEAAIKVGGSRGCLEELRELEGPGWWAGSESDKGWGSVVILEF